MYLLEYDENGKLINIIPNAKNGLAGAYVDRLPASIEVLEEEGTIEKVLEQDKIYYKIIGGNK